MLLLLFALQSDLIRQERINYCTQAKIQNNLSVRQKTLLTCWPLENSDIAVNQLFCLVSNHAVTLSHVYEKKRPIYTHKVKGIKHLVESLIFKVHNCAKTKI